MPITFEVDPTKTPEEDDEVPSSCTLEGYMEDELSRGNETYQGPSVPKGKLLQVTNSGKGKYVKTRFNGFVGACLTAYNKHYPWCWALMTCG